MIDKLEMLIAVAREEHFGRAAESLGITQPTLSAGIKQLEGQLGVLLIWRGSRFRGLTPEGQRVLGWARRIVGDARTLRDEMRAARHGLSGDLRLAVIPTALTVAARLTVRFGQANPNVRFTILSRTSVEILQMIEDLEADAGISYLDNEPLGRVTAIPLYREEYRLVCGEGHALAGRDEVAWSDLGGVALCLLTPDNQNRRIINQNLHAAGGLLRGSDPVELDPHPRRPRRGRRLGGGAAAPARRVPRRRAAGALDPDPRDPPAAHRRPDRAVPRAAHAGARGVVADEPGAGGGGSIGNADRSTECQY